MAKFDFDDVEFIRMIEKLDCYDEVAEKMLNESAPVLTKSLKEELQKHKRTGELIRSVKASKAKKNINGWFLVVRPTGARTVKAIKSGKETKIRNMAILAHMEYGTKKQPATPVLAKAVNNAREKVNNVMEAVYEKEVEQ